MRFSASYDRTTKVISALVAVLSLTLALALPWFVGVLSVLILAIAYAYSPRSYSIAGGVLTIDRFLPRVRIPLGEITAVRAATPDDLRGTLRLWGSGGLFGYHGLFRTSTLGKCWWYVTRRDRIVIVATHGRTHLLSPDDADEFVQAIPTAPGAPIPQRGGARAGLSIIAVVVVVVLGVVSLGLLYNPGPPAYTLTATSLTIHDRFYLVTLGARDVDLTAIRVVDLEQSPEWRPTRRTNGFANANYQSGWFETRGGERLRLYRAASRQLVLLPAKGDADTVLLEVADPTAFAAQLRGQWTH